MNLQINNEYSTLKKAIVASAITYYDHEAINNNQAYYYKHSSPSKSLLIEQQKVFFDVLDTNGVELLFAEEKGNCPDQLNTRDPAFCIGDTLYISAMKEPLRAHEKDGLRRIISKISSPVVRLNNCSIEGGDVLVNDNIVYVGISRRTNMEGIYSLKAKMRDQYEVIPIILKPGFLHLDTVFNILGNNKALVCHDAIDRDSYEILHTFSLLEITLEEQLHLGTNVLSITPDKVISQPQNARINNMLKEHGFHVIEVDYSEGSKIGGAFRCATCPLVRE